MPEAKEGVSFFCAMVRLTARLPPVAESLIMGLDVGPLLRRVWSALMALALLALALVIGVFSVPSFIQGCRSVAEDVGNAFARIFGSEPAERRAYTWAPSSIQNLNRRSALGRCCTSTVTSTGARFASRFSLLRAATGIPIGFASTTTVS